MPKKKIIRAAREVVEAPPEPKRGPGRPRKAEVVALPSRKAAVAKARTPVAAPTTKPATRNGLPKVGTKTEKIYKLLTRKSGCTRAEVLEATQWPAISIQKISETLGLKLRKDDANRPYRYYGSP